MTEVDVQPPLVELLEREQAPVLARPFFGDGPASPITGSLAQVPELLGPTMPFLGAVLGPSWISVRDKEIVILRTSAVMGCRYCTEAHTVVALDSGLSRDEVRALRGELPLDAAFADARERLLLEWVDAVALGRGPVDRDLQARAAAVFGDHGLVELTVTITATLMLNRYCSALGLPTSPATLARLAEEGLG